MIYHASLSHFRLPASSHFKSRHITSLAHHEYDPLMCYVSHQLFDCGISDSFVVHSFLIFLWKNTHASHVNSCCTLPSSLAFTLAHACLVTPSCMCALFPFTSCNPPLFVSLTHPFYFLTYTINVITVRVFPSNLSG